jgi:hypothetical protein
LQGFDALAVANDVAADFSAPEILPGFGPREQVAIVSVPEAAVNKKHRIQTRKDHVRSARQFCVEPISETLGVKTPAQDQLGLRVLASNAGHHPAADFRGDNVNHLQHDA